MTSFCGGEDTGGDAEVEGREDVEDEPDEDDPEGLYVG